MKKQVPIWPIAALGLVIVAAVAYFTLIGPKRAEAARLSSEVASLETEIQTAKLAAGPEKPETIKVADLFELTKAMPDRPDLPGIILELDAIAESVGIEFVSIAPEPRQAGAGYRILPIRFVYQGDYFQLSDFLFRVRGLAVVRDGKLLASGRFFSLDFLKLEEGEENFPQIEAELVISAYVYDPTAVSTIPPPVPTTTAATTTTATTTAATAAASAAGAP